MNYFSGKIKLDKIIYPVLLLLIGVCLGLAVYVSIKYLYSITNRALSPSADAINGLIELDLADYNTIAGKIGLATVNLGEEVVVEETAANIIMPTPEATVTTTAPQTNFLAKIDLKIAIYNATKRSGLAAELKARLEQAGFLNISTGSLAASATSTVISLKSQADFFYDELSKTIGESYPNLSRTSLPADSQEDVWIIIGQQ
jgi:hypothetical protein